MMEGIFRHVLDKMHEVNVGYLYSVEKLGEARLVADQGLRMSRVRSVAQTVVLLVGEGNVASIVSTEGRVRLMLVLSNSGGGMTIHAGVRH
jgi:hypothetical protein